MKLFKLIMNCIIVILLVLSVVLNIFMFSVLGIKDGESFKQAILAKEILSSFSAVTLETSDESENIEISDVDNNNIEDETKPEEFKPSNTEQEKEVFYQDENVVIKFVESEDGPFGPVHKFEIENISDKPYTITFTDLYINEYKVFVSGLTCENLLPGKKAIDELVLLESEWEQFTEEPTELVFKIKFIEPDSWFTEYEIEQVTFKVEG